MSTTGQTWKEMIDEWEADRPNHHDLCWRKAGWDENCVCDFIKKVTEYNNARA